MLASHANADVWGQLFKKVFTSYLEKNIFPYMIRSACRGSEMYIWHKPATWPGLCWREDDKAAANVSWVTLTVVFLLSVWTTVNIWEMETFYQRGYRLNRTLSTSCVTPKHEATQKTTWASSRWQSKSAFISTPNWDYIEDASVSDQFNNE